ncbi:hypothetical protein B0H10DRAFT_2224086 [Mycena sp. CBHHK59/15]|nr:hypothetical protein B0H10DRAFT_2224086 [Mycena sp. CBHHK59/15]
MDRQSNPPVAHSGKVSLENAFSAVDLLTAIRDVAKALRYLSINEGILHKHIGFDTIRIQSDGADGVKGLVVDLDFPNPAEGSSSDPNDPQTCTSFAFQSNNQLRTRLPYSHTDDLESLFYVICWACYAYDHTGLPDKFRPALLTQWTKDKYAKGGFVTSCIDSHVNRYMGCQRDIVEGVIDELGLAVRRRKSDADADYAAFLTIIDQGIDRTTNSSCGHGPTHSCSKMASLVVGRKRGICELGETEHDPQTLKT